MSTKQIELWVEKYGEVSIGYAEDFKPNDDFQKMGLVCQYEHCIENMTLEDSEMSCPVFGHDCPIGKECDETAVWERLARKLKKSKDII